MKIDGAKVCNEGVLLDNDCQDKIRKIVKAIKAVSLSPEITIQFFKRGKTVEGLLWGKANSIPIGVYRQGVSVSHVLENMQKRVQKECIKVWKLSGHQTHPRKQPSYNHSPSAMAG